VGLIYNGAYALVMYRWFGAAFTLLSLLVFLPHVGFYIDRVRQFTEHNLMPLDNRNGARSFGVGFGGLSSAEAPGASRATWCTTWWRVSPGISRSCCIDISSGC
jgi:hypothetical protein